MNDRTVKVVLVLATVPLTVFAFILAVSTGGSWHAGSIAGTATVLLVTPLIWRRYVRWTGRVTAGTATWSALVLTQAILWQPVWDMTGCTEKDELCTAQSLHAAGWWCFACSLTWWGFAAFRKNARVTRKAALVMTPNTVRLVLAFALVPFLPGLFFFYAMTEKFWTGNADDGTYFRAYAVCAGITAFFWLRLWHPVVDWTPRRFWWTGGLTALLLISPLLIFAHAGVSWLTWRLPPSFDEIWETFCWLAPLIAAAIYFAGTAWVWRSIPGAAGEVNAGESDDVTSLIACPKCSYSLIGLSEVRCPECGWRATLDAFVRACFQLKTGDI